MLASGRVCVCEPRALYNHLRVRACEVTCKINQHDIPTAWYNFFEQGRTVPFWDIIFTLPTMDRDVAYAGDDEAAPKLVHALGVIGAESSHLGRHSPLSIAQHMA